MAIIYVFALPVSRYEHPKAGNTDNLNKQRRNSGQLTYRCHYEEQEGTE